MPYWRAAVHLPCVPGERFGRFALLRARVPRPGTARPAQSFVPPTARPHSTTTPPLLALAGAPSNSRWPPHRKIEIVTSSVQSKGRPPNIRSATASRQRRTRPPSRLRVPSRPRPQLLISAASPPRCPRAARHRYDNFVSTCFLRPLLAGKPPPTPVHPLAYPHWPSRGPLPYISLEPHSSTGPATCRLLLLASPHCTQASHITQTEVATDEASSREA